MPRFALTKRAVAISALLCLLPLSAANAASTGGEPPHGQGLARGRLVNESGQPLAGTKIGIYAWPTETAESHFEEGESFTFTELGAATTDARGRYAISARDQKAIASLLKDNADVNLQVIAHPAGQPAVSRTLVLSKISGSEKVRPKELTDFAVEPAGKVANDAVSGTATRTSLASAAEPTPQPTITASNAPAGEQDPATVDGDPGLDWPDAEPVKDSVDIPADDPFLNGEYTDATTGYVCGSILHASLGGRYVWVGGTYVTTSGVYADFQYSSGATSSLGMGVSVGGAYGSFKASGSVSSASTLSTDYATSRGLQHNYTQFMYGKFRQFCGNTTTGYQVRARYFIGGGSSWKPAAAPMANYCTSYGAGQGVTKSSSTAYSFSTGADVSGAIGIDLSSQTGYSSGAKVYYKFEQGRRLCGTHAYPGQPTSSPKRLVAKL